MSDPIKQQPRGDGTDQPLVLLMAVHDYFEAAMSGRPHPGAPGHSHDVAGRWDKDGSVCEWCAIWNRVRECIKQNIAVCGQAPAAGTGTQNGLVGTDQ